MRRNLIETVLGAVVLIVAVGFLVYAYTATDQPSLSDGYELSAQFDRVDGLDTGSEVRISGIPVGTVVNQSLDPATYRARVRFTVNSSIELPEDTSAEIVSDGLLGGKYLALVPGGSPDTLAPGGEIRFTQSSISLESLIGQYIFGQGGQQNAEPPAAP
jgi:phospholipid/cholesterol/gamma-HCH transport system substrate-binding protein